MTREEIFERMNKVFREVFDNDELTVSEKTTASDVAGWDSLMHVTLISEVEDEFDVHFAMKEIADISNVGEMVDLIFNRITM